MVGQSAGFGNGTTTWASASAPMLPRAAVADAVPDVDAVDLVEALAVLTVAEAQHRAAFVVDVGDEVVASDSDSTADRAPATRRH